MSELPNHLASSQPASHRDGPSGYVASDSAHANTVSEDERGGTASNPEPTFRQLCRTVASHFLQTAVVVDDEAQYGGSPAKPGPLKVPDTMARRLAAHDIESEYQEAATVHSIVGVPDSEADSIQTETSEVDAKQLVDAFAQLQLVCAVVKPARDEEALFDRLLAVARRSDLLILDWNLDRDSGLTTRDLIKRVLDKDQRSGGRLRLICVYTGRLDLQIVQDQLAEDLEQFGVKKDLRDGGFGLGSDACRIVILAKPNIRMPDHNQMSVVPVHVLPERLLDEFTELTIGLMPGLALECLAAVRDNAHHLLRRFHAGLDVPFLSQRALAEDPETFAVTLAASEMQAVLEETEAHLVLSSDYVQAWAHDHFAGGVVPQLRRKRSMEEVDPDWVKELLSTPRVAAKAPYAPNGSRLGPVILEDVKSLADLFVGSSQDPMALEHEFARLSSLSRSTSHQFVGAKPPILHLGTIVKVLSLPDDRELPARTPKWLAQKMQQKRDGLPTPGSFWLSLQPDCDSMRLDDARSFPMAPLIKVEESEARAGSKFDLVALDPDEGKPLYFRTSTRPYQLRMISFAPSESVIRATNDSPGPLLTDGDGVTWLWIAQLRFAHALRLANSLGGAMARVGLDESEWLRRHSRSSD